MPAKTKESAEKAPALKGQEAEGTVLKYMKKVNRPYGAVDVSANLKNTVTKTATQKILASLADKGDLTHKQYGKSAYYVAKQSDFEDMPAEKLTILEAEIKSIEEENKSLSEQLKQATGELNKLKTAPSDEELKVQLKEARAAVKKTMEYLVPLRSGTPLISEEEIAQLDKDWLNWRKEWVERRKKFMTLWQLLSDSLPPQQASELAEELGIEYDSSEHAEIERGPLCVVPPKRR